MTNTQPLPKSIKLAIILSSVLYVSYCMRSPVAILANAGHDDLLFVQHARSLVSGHWLGAFSQMTLPKGPGYSFFLEFNALLGVPVTLSQALLYSVACYLIASATFELSKSYALALLVFILMQWHPGIPAERVLRDDIYAAQSLILLSCLMQIALIPQTTRTLNAWATAAGLALAWMWMTREEGVWILPAIVILFGARFLQAPDQRRDLAQGLFMLTACAVATWSTVATINRIDYGIFEVVDFKSAAFSNALRAVQSVRVGDPVPHVPAPEKVRLELAKNSPAFATLMPYFDGPGKGWEAPGCSIYPETCGDIAGGWFMWAFRDAVASTGHYSSARDAARFYSELTHEVNSACSSGALHCENSLLAYMPAMTKEQWLLIPTKIKDIALLLAWQDKPVRWPASGGGIGDINQFNEFVGNPRRTQAAAEEQRFASGWFYAPGGGWIQLRCSDAQGESVVPVQPLASPDIALHFGDPSADKRRFFVSSPVNAECRLQLTGASASDPAISLTDIAKKSYDDLQAGSVLLVDSAHSNTTCCGEPLIAAIGAALDRVYRLALPVLGVVSLAFLVVNSLLIAIGRRRLTSIFLLICSLWCLLLARCAILILVDISSFPAVNTLYLSACFPLFVLVTLLSVYGAAREIRGTR